MGSRPDSRARVTRNFIRTYGRAQFRRLIRGFEANESGAAMGREMGVSRERIRQWKHIFGETVTFYNVYPEVKRLLGSP